MLKSENLHELNLSELNIAQTKKIDGGTDTGVYDPDPMDGDNSGCTRPSLPTLEDIVSN
ncbi:hypothetical protein [Fodinibius sp. Rm-B-1B1-1]|uniref:hypothetical protein n=1 Tax=Fodinibius alkaliphilus TaxID=3140241 RepID=UPI003159E788